MISLITTLGNRPEKFQRCFDSVASFSELTVFDRTNYHLPRHQGMAMALNSLLKGIDNGEWIFYLADDEVLEGNPLPYLEKESDFLTVKCIASDKANEKGIPNTEEQRNYLYTRFIKKAPDTCFEKYHWIIFHKGRIYEHYKKQLSSVLPEDVMVKEIW